MVELERYQDIEYLSAQSGMSLLYLSRPSCGVCGAIKPKVQTMLSSFPEIRAYEVNLDKVPEAAGQLSVFTIPAVLVYAEGKEIVREARYFSIEGLKERILRPYSFIFGDD